MPSKDPTIPSYLYTYDPLLDTEKERIISLLQRIITVSLDAQKIIKELNTI